MKVGQLLWQPTPDMSYSHHARLKETEEIVQLCEEFGYHGVAFGENHFSNYGYSPNPLMLAVGLGRNTERLNIATAVAVLPFWNPIRFAEDAATADLMLEGRLELGISWGYQQLEFNGFGVPYEERQPRYQEALDIIMQAWTQNEVQVDGRYYQVPRAINVLPKPYTKPHPRIFVGAVHEQSLKSAADTDFKVFGISQGDPDAARRNREIYLAERRRLGRTGDFFTISMNRQVHVVDSTRPEKIEEAKQDLMRRSLTLIRLGEGLRAGLTRYHAGEVTPVPLPDEPDPETLLKNAIFGTPDQVIEQLRHLRDVVGVQEFNCMTDFGGLDHESNLRTIKLMGKEVLPALHADERAHRNGEQQRAETVSA